MTSNPAIHKESEKTAHGSTLPPPMVGGLWDVEHFTGLANVEMLVKQMPRQIRTIYLQIHVAF
jgi:hypothetical protein